MLKINLNKPAAKPAAPVNVTTRDEADRSTLEFARATRLCERLQADFNAEVERLYARFLRRYQPHAARAQAHEDAVIEFARRELETVNARTARPVKSIKLGFGRVKFSRDRDRVVMKQSVASIITNLKNLALSHLIKSKECVEADDLRTIAPELHGTVGFAIEATPVTGTLDLDHQELTALPEFAAAR